MKKFLIVLLSLPMFAFSNSIGLGVTSWDGDEEGITLEWDAGTDNFAFDFDYHDVDGFNLYTAHLGYAFGSLSEGAFHIGVTNMDADYYDDGSGETGLTLGYSRRGSEEGNYSIRVSDLDNIGTILEFDYKTTSGFTFGVTDFDGEVTMWSIGYAFYM